MPTPSLSHFASGKMRPFCTPVLPQNEMTTSFWKSHKGSYYQHYQEPHLSLGFKCIKPYLTLKDFVCLHPFTVCSLTACSSSDAPWFSNLTAPSLSDTSHGATTAAGSAGIVWKPRALSKGRKNGKDIVMWNEWVKCINSKAARQSNWDCGILHRSCWAE